MTSSNALVIGGDSSIGRVLKLRLQSRRQAVWETTRRRDRVNPSCQYLDLADIAGWNPPEDIAVAYLCAGVTSLQACRENPAATARVNVENMAAVAEMLTGAGAQVVLLSTNLVFDGSVASRSADAPYSAKTEYGRQKALLEQKLLALGGKVCIVRLSKVVAPDFPLFKRWLHSLLQGKTIHAFSDFVFSPVRLEEVVNVLELAGARNSTGIIQFSAARDVSYADAALYLAEKLGVDGGLVNAGKVDVPMEHIPLHTTLETARLEREFKISPQDPRAAFDPFLAREGLPGTSQ